MSKAIILGGSKGLGYKIAKELLSQGITPISLSRTPPEDTQIIHVPLDLSDRGSLRPAMRLLTPHVKDVSHIIWSAGSRQKGNLFRNEEPNRIADMIETMITYPLLLLRELLREIQSPVQFIAIGSTTAKTYKIDELLYRNVKRFQIEFAESLHLELFQENPGSRILIANPGGMRTSFWDGSNIDHNTLALFLDAAIVSNCILETAKNQPANTVQELTLSRLGDSSGVPKKTLVTLVY